MTAICWVLQVSIGVVIYVWAGYPLLVFGLASLFSRKRHPTGQSYNPFVSVIIPVHNEEQKIATKLRDCLDLLYPHDRLDIVVVSDGSTDSTAEIVLRLAAEDSRIHWLSSKTRVGKSGVQNLAARHAKGDLLFFTDANTAMPPGVLRTMVENMADPQIGLCTATVLFGRPEDAVEKSQGVYWRYELFLRSAESDLGILATGSGQALLVRRKLFRPLPPCYGDDCIMPLDVRAQGFGVVQEREAAVFDAMPHSIEGELRARIRMTARNWTGTLSRPSVLNPLRYPLTSLGLFSHKLLRWLTPFLLAIIFVSSFTVALFGLYRPLWWLQVGFYLSALVGWQLTRKQRPAWVFGYCFSFCLANIGFLLGMVKAFRGQQIVAY